MTCIKTFLKRTSFLFLSPIIFVLFTLFMSLYLVVWVLLWLFGIEDIVDKYLFRAMCFIDDLAVSLLN